MNYQESQSLNTPHRLSHARLWPTIKSPVRPTAPLPFVEVRNQSLRERRNVPLDETTNQESGGTRNEREVDSTCSGNMTTPWQVGLMMETTDNNEKERQCGGVLIHKHWVLTAAHCVVNTIRTFVSIGSTNYLAGFLGTEGQKTTVNDTIIHEHYRPADKDNRIPKHDIALLRLSQDVVLGRHVAVAQIPPRNSSLTKGGTSMIISGWGRTRDNPLFRERLRCALVPVVAHDDCVAAYKNLEKPVNIRQSQMCTSYSSSGDGPCNGDSGGGLVHRGSDEQKTVVGIISWSKGCGEHYTVYTNVQKYRPWLLRNVPELTRKHPED